jgi:hypothetical protein
MIGVIESSHEHKIWEVNIYVLNLMTPDFCIYFCFT